MDAAGAFEVIFKQKPGLLFGMGAVLKKSVAIPAIHSSVFPNTDNTDERIYTEKIVNDLVRF